MLVTGLFVFALILLLAVLLSGLANRSVLSAAVLFLAAGFFAGPQGLNLVQVPPDNEFVSRFVELALFGVLFTDGMHISLGELRKNWALPGRALLLGLPLTLLFIAGLARFIVGLPWTESFLIGAVLSPTDPVFAAAVVGRKEIPHRLRHLLNVESGVNDGLALPIVLAILAVLGGTEWHVPAWLGEIALGIAIGVVIPWVVIKVERSRFFSATHIYEPLLAFSIGLVVYGLGLLVHANMFLAAFAAGITVASMSQEVKNAFYSFGELIVELLKLASVFIFGALISLEFFVDTPLIGYVFVLAVLFITRPVALELALLGSDLDWRERIATAWFGPKGFASVVYGLLVFGSGIENAASIFRLIAIVIVASMIAHSSTDVLMAGWLSKHDPKSEKDEGELEEAAPKKEKVGEQETRKEEPLREAEPKDEKTPG